MKQGLSSHPLARPPDSVRHLGKSSVCAINRLGLKCGCMMNPAEFANIAQAEQAFWWYQGMRDILSRFLDPLISGRRVRNVLEAGCGTGYNALELQQRNGWHVFPLDLQMEGLAYARSLGLARLVQADIAGLPFRCAAFDAVISLDVIVHFPRGEEDRPLAEFARVLAPGGLLVLRVSALDMLHSRHSQFTCERQRFTKSRLTELAARHGIRVIRCTYANAILFPVALAKFRLWEPLTRQAPGSGVQPVSAWLNRILKVPLAAESSWLGAGFNLPVGQSLILAGEKIA